MPSLYFRNLSHPADHTLGLRSGQRVEKICLLVP